MRSPTSNGWINERDLPVEKIGAMYDRHQRNRELWEAACAVHLMFEAGGLRQWKWKGEGEEPSRNAMREWFKVNHPTLASEAEREIRARIEKRERKPADVPFDTGSIIWVTAPTDKSMWPTSAAWRPVRQPLLRDAISWWRVAAARQRIDAGLGLVENQEIGIVNERAAKSELRPHAAEDDIHIDRTSAQCGLPGGINRPASAANTSATMAGGGPPSPATAT